MIKVGGSNLRRVMLRSKACQLIAMLARSAGSKLDNYDSR